MDGYLKQSATATVIIGPFLDATDGCTAETAIEVSSATLIDLYKGSTKSDLTTTSAGGNTMAHVANGYYSIVLSSGILDTVGRFAVTGYISGALPIWHYYTILPANVYDSLVGGTTTLDTKPAAAALTAGVFGAACISSGVFAGAALTGGVLQAGILTAGVFGLTSISSGVFASSALTAGIIAQAALSAGKFDTGFLTAGLIGVAALSAGKFSSGALTSGIFGPSALTAGVFGLTSISSGVFASSALTAGLFAQGFLSAGKFDTGALTAGLIAANAVIAIANGEAIANGTCQAGSTVNNIILAAEAVADDYYNQCLVTIVSGTGAGQARLITDYATSTDTAIVDRPWVTAPTNDSLYRIYPFSGVFLIDSGVALAGDSASIKLASSASGVASAYIGHTVVITGGTGAGQARLITSYTAAGTATVSHAWTTNPDTTSVYLILPVGRTYVNAIATGAITDGAMASGIITSAKFGNAALTAGVFGLTSISSGVFASSALTAGIIAQAALSSGKFDTGVLTAGLFAGSALVLATLAQDVKLQFSSGIQKNVTFSNLELLMVDSSDHRTGKTGLTVTMTRSIDGGAFAAGSAEIAEVGNGIYQADLHATDTNGGVVTYRFVASGADDTFITVKTSS